MLEAAGRDARAAGGILASMTTPASSPWASPGASPIRSRPQNPAHSATPSSQPPDPRKSQRPRSTPKHPGKIKPARSSAPADVASSGTDGEDGDNKFDLYHRHRRDALAMDRRWQKGIRRAAQAYSEGDKGAAAALAREARLLRQARPYRSNATYLKNSLMLSSEPSFLA